MHFLGYKKLGSPLIATSKDRFRIGSNTKAITGFIAAQLVKDGKIAWNTKFFDLFPELKDDSRQIYYNLTLLDLLSFRAPLFSYSYPNKKPKKEQFTGDDGQQRYQFTAWFFRHKAVSMGQQIIYSNLGYVAAGLMMEKASGKSYKQLVQKLGERIGCNFSFGNPNSADSLQTWGHDENLVPDGKGDSFKLNWLLPAGNINVSLPDYIKFIQVQLLGLQGKSDLLAQKEFKFIHFGLPVFAVGWFWEINESKHHMSKNIGNPGTFLTEVNVIPETNKAYIIFTNSQNSLTSEGMEVLFKEMKKKYGD